ncbi:uncharacterized protein [Lolium perenne]|uniref:uncharacterized protein n=1 Tax=Lolium perenne TaxID=4522 RepID=UPI0021F65F38|nr:WRKY transcription factor 6-like [Lolium perenne]
MAMASTTSAASFMLLSGSMPSADGQGLMSSNFLAHTVLPCSSSMATISASAPFPTVTLDLTHGPPPPNALLLSAARPTAPGQFQIPLPGGAMAPACTCQTSPDCILLLIRKKGDELSGWLGPSQTSFQPIASQKNRPDSVTV